MTGTESSHRESQAGGLGIGSRLAAATVSVEGRPGASASVDGGGRTQSGMGLRDQQFIGHGGQGWGASRFAQIAGTSVPGVRVRCALVLGSLFRRPRAACHARAGSMAAHRDAFERQSGTGFVRPNGWV